MIVPKGSRDLSRDLYGEHNATAVLAVLCLAAFMAFTAMLLILGYDRASDPAVTQELPSD